MGTRKAESKSSNIKAIDDDDDDDDDDELKSYFGQDLMSSYCGNFTPNSQVSLVIFLASRLRLVISIHVIIGKTHMSNEKNLGCLGYMGVEPKIGGKTPKWMVYFMENPIKMDDLG